MNHRNCSDQAVRPLNDVEVEGEVAEGEGEEAAGGEEEEGEYGERKVQKMCSPCKPSALEVEEHNLTHLPYRSWCEHCVRGRKKELPHAAVKGKSPQALPEFHFDWAFPGEEQPGETITILVGRQRNTRMKLSAMVPTKSTGGVYSSTRMCLYQRVRA